MSAFDEETGMKEIQEVLNRYGVNGDIDKLVEEICNVRRLMPPNKYLPPKEASEIDSYKSYTLDVAFNGSVEVCGGHHETTVVTGTITGEELINIIKDAGEQ